MAIAFTVTPAEMTTEQYDETIKRLEDAGAVPAPGLLYHVCFGKQGNLQVVEVWKSREAYVKNVETLMPILKETGITPGQPEIWNVHNIVG